MQSDTIQIFAILESFLDKERRAILNGAFEDIDRIAHEKELLLEGKKLVAPDQKTLERLRRKAERNQNLLAAAIRGVRSVSARLEALRNGPAELNTYDKSGQRTTLGGQQKGALQRRA